MKYNRICQILGIEKPVIQGPLSWLTDARLVAAVIFLPYPVTTGSPPDKPLCLSAKPK